MSLRPPPLATFIIMLMIWIHLIQPIFAMQDSTALLRNDTQSSLLCTPFGGCEPCPADSINEPFCQPFGNRRLMHCINSTTITPISPEQTQPPFQSNGPTEHPKGPHPEGEILAWESCGRIPARERADFYEFVACNVVFALISLCVLFLRSRRLRLMQARQLAARIGLIRADGGGGGGARGTRL